MTALFPAATAVGNSTLNIGIFVGFVVITLAIVIKVAAGKKTAEQYYTAAGAFSGRQNGIAIAGDYLSAASFLGIAGAIALRGLDGFVGANRHLTIGLQGRLTTVHHTATTHHAVGYSAGVGKFR